MPSVPLSSPLPTFSVCRLSSCALGFSRSNLRLFTNACSVFPFLGLLLCILPIFCFFSAFCLFILLLSFFFLLWYNFLMDKPYGKAHKPWKGVFMIKCVGIQFKKGSFTDQVSGKDISFDNVIFHLETRLAPDPTVFGLQVDQVKIKRSSLEYILGGAFDPQAFLDHEVILEYTPVNGKPVLTNLQPLD